MYVQAQLDQAKSMGLPPDVVPPMVIPSHDEMDRELRVLTQQQEKLLAELQKTAAEEDKVDAPLYDKVSAINYKILPGF